MSSYILLTKSEKISWVSFCLIVILSSPKPWMLRLNILHFLIYSLISWALSSALDLFKLTLAFYISQQWLFLQARKAEQDKDHADWTVRLHKSMSAVTEWQKQITELEQGIKQKSELIEKTSRSIEQANRRLQRILQERGPDVHTGRQELTKK